jgi:hypothetical protein
MVATHNIDAATEARGGGRAALAKALSDSRATTLALLDAYVDVLGESLVVPYSTQLNPPLWECGHVAWFQDWWLARSRERERGIACDPDHLNGPTGAWRMPMRSTTPAASPTLRAGRCRCRHWR